MFVRDDYESMVIGGWVDLNVRGDGVWRVVNGYLWFYRITGTKAYAYHTGIDLVLQRGMTSGSKVYAIDQGDVVYANNPGIGTWGNVIVIKHERVYARYLHLEKIYVRAGERVRRGQLVGLVGKTGMEWLKDGHLHFDLSFTSILQNNPLYWPGRNLTNVANHFVDPSVYLLNPHKEAVCIAYPHLNVRASPHLNAAIIGRIPHMERVSVKGYENGFAVLERGYASARYLLH
jgi:murein DD-endopeptidase MepM/ murein hydrolase activator NlpD